MAIVDDDDSVRRALHRLILSLSYQSRTFASGEEFLEALQESTPDCVLLDLHMPGLKGLDVLHRMRTEGRHVPAIAMTGFDQHGMREKCLKAGAAAYLVKPLERAVVAAAIADATATSS
ncbi:response regulator [Mesorhizobium sp. 1B3]|uniref:response regulator n=1 Tax=Mesorhizobium sp. 1B3 TaxID=3243599 RepID=UPI003D98B30A